MFVNYYASECETCSQETNTHFPLGPTVGLVAKFTEVLHSNRSAAQP